MTEIKFNHKYKASSTYTVHSYVCIFVEFVSWITHNVAICAGGTIEVLDAKFVYLYNFFTSRIIPITFTIISVSIILTEI